MVATIPPPGLPADLAELYQRASGRETAEAARLRERKRAALPRVLDSLPPSLAAAAGPAPAVTDTTRHTTWAFRRVGPVRPLLAVLSWADGAWAVDGWEVVGRWRERPFARLDDAVLDAVRPDPADATGAGEPGE